jgi:hypothetical protein
MIIGDRELLRLQDEHGDYYDDTVIAQQTDGGMGDFPAIKAEVGWEEEHDEIVDLIVDLLNFAHNGL